MNDENERIEETTPTEQASELPAESNDAAELEQLRTDLENVRGQVTRLEHERCLLAKGVPEEDLDYYTFKIERMEGAKDDFAKAAKEYLKAHPIKRATVSSGAELSGGRKSKPQTTNELMNQILRGR